MSTQGIAKEKKENKPEEKLELSQEDIKALKYVASEIRKQEINRAYDRPTNATQEAKVKMWNDLTADEKIERMREEVKRSMLQTQRQLSQMDRQIHHVKRHTHNEKGQAIVEQPLTEYYDHGENSLLAGAKEVDSNGGAYF